MVYANLVAPIVFTVYGCVGQSLPTSLTVPQFQVMFSAMTRSPSNDRIFLNDIDHL